MSSQVFIDGIEFCQSQIDFGKRFKDKPFSEFIEYFDMAWDYDISEPEDIYILARLHRYLNVHEYLKCIKL